MRQLNLLITLIVFLIATVPIAAQELSDWGYRLEGSDITVPLYEGSEEFFPFSLAFPVWSPDGKWIAFTGLFYHKIFIIPVEGGEATVVYESDQSERESTGSSSVNSIWYPCFSPDSQEITFGKTIYDEARGSIIEIDGSHHSFKNGIKSLESVNIYTGEHRIIAEGDFPQWSNNGRYLCYKNFDHMIYLNELLADHHWELTIYDTETGETWFLTDQDTAPGYRYTYGEVTFTPDDSHIILSMRTGETKYRTIGGEYYPVQFYQIPIMGGVPEQITFYEGGRYGEVRNGPSFSHDGKWILYNDVNKKGLYNVKNICAINTITGETFEVLPYEEEIDATFGMLSPDGKKFCYIRQDRRETVNPTWELWIKDFDPDSFIVNVEAEKPESFVMLNNYPNPFNLSTTLDFTLPEAGFTQLVIYNIMGQKVRELMAQDMPAGVHTVVWDGRDENGSPVSSGMFVSRLTSGENVVSNRMMLVK